MSAERAEGAEESGPGDTGHDTGHRGGHWPRGTQILWRYLDNRSGRPHICRPATVVEDSPALLAAWVAPGTPCVKPELADGTPVYREPLATRYTKPRTTAFAPWTGTGVLKLASPGEPWSVWLFWEAGWQFKNWYVNLEAPRRRWSGGIDSEDHFLDIVVYPDGGWELRDEDEFAAAQRAGLMSAEQAGGVTAAAQRALQRIRDWQPPFCDGWEDWRPDQDWPLPLLPEDWDGTPAPVRPGEAPRGREHGTGRETDREERREEEREEEQAAGHEAEPEAELIAGHTRPAGS